MNINDYSKNIDKNRLSVINDIFEKFSILFSEKKYNDIPGDFFKEKKNLCR